MNHDQIAVDLVAIRALPEAQKLWLIGFLWDELEKEGEPVPIPSHIAEFVARRRAELAADPSLKVPYDEMMRRLDKLCG